MKVESRLARLEKMAAESMAPCACPDVVYVHPDKRDQMPPWQCPDCGRGRKFVIVDIDAL